jgi:hypothetical protein
MGYDSYDLGNLMISVIDGVNPDMDWIGKIDFWVMAFIWNI